MYDTIETPTRSRPAFVGWQSGGRQEFPTDVVLQRARDQRLRAAGLIKVRRIPATSTHTN